MAQHVIEAARSGRAKCRGCGKPIGKGEFRLGERLENPFGEGEITLWFHPTCAAFKRPQTLLDALEHAPPELGDPALLRAQAEFGLAHPRVPRIDGVERAVAARARCRACRERIEKGAFRIKQCFFGDDARFSSGGFVHLDCAKDHFGTLALLDRLLAFSDQLDAGDRADLEQNIAALDSG